MYREQQGEHGRKPNVHKGLGKSKWSRRSEEYDNSDDFKHCKPEYRDTRVEREPLPRIPECRHQRQQYPNSGGHSDHPTRHDTPITTTPSDQTMPSDATRTFNDFDFLAR